MKKIILCLSLVFLLISCSKDESNPVNSNEDKYLNGNLQSSESYFPTSKGSWWKYSGTLSGMGSLVSTVTVDKEVTLNGVYYAKMLSVANGQTHEGFLRVKNNEYYSIGTINLNGATQDFEMCLLKSDKPIGEKWESGIINNKGTDNKYVSEIIEKNATEVVNSKTFKNVQVIKVTNYSKIPIINQWMPNMSFNTYYAKGVGLIKSDYGIYGIYELADYSIK